MCNTQTRLLLVCLLAVSFTTAYGQNTVRTLLNNGFRLPQSTDTLKNLAPDSANNSSSQLPNSLFKKFFNKEFAKTINPASNSNIGRFSALDIAKGEFALATNFNIDKGVLGIKLAGSSLDGVAPIITNTKLNTGLELSAQYNFVVSDKNSLVYDAVSFDRYQYKVQELKRARKLSTDIGYQRQRRVLQLQHARLLAKIEALKAKRDNLYKIEPNERLLALRKDSIDVDSIKFQNELTSIDEQILRLGKPQQYLYTANRAYAEGIKAAEADIKILGGYFAWLSLGYGIKHTSFSHLNPKAVYSKQITDKTAYNHEIRLQYSVFNNTPAENETYYWDLSLAASIKDNFSVLKKQNIREEDTIRNGNSVRIFYKEYIAYKGDYSKNKFGLVFASNYYRFFGAGNDFAWHFALEHKVLASSNSTTNAGTGILVTFQDKKEEKTIINTELFINAVDIFNNTPGNDSFLKRSTLELRLIFPLMFNLIK